MFYSVAYKLLHTLTLDTASRYDQFVVRIISLSRGKLALLKLCLVEKALNSKLFNTLSNMTSKFKAA